MADFSKQQMTAVGIAALLALTGGAGSAQLAGEADGPWVTTDELQAYGMAGCSDGIPSYWFCMNLDERRSLTLFAPIGIGAAGCTSNDHRGPNVTPRLVGLAFIDLDSGMPTLNARRSVHLWPSLFTLDICFEPPGATAKLETKQFPDGAPSYTFEDPEAAGGPDYLGPSPASR